MSAHLSLDGIVLITGNLGAQVRFYNQQLGLPVRSRYSDAVLFDCGGARLGLFGSAHHPEATRRLGEADHGVGHLEFGIRSSALPALAKDLTERGHKAYGETFEDVDGNLFHFVPNHHHRW